MKVLSNLLIIILIFVLGLGDATEVNISSIKELAAYAAKSGNVISMSPGVYPLNDYLTMESLIARHNRKEF